MTEQMAEQSQESLWKICRTPVILAIVGGAIDTIGFIALFGFFTAHVTGNLVLAGAGWLKSSDGIWIKLGAIPLFILTVAVTKMMIDRSQTQHRTIAWLFLAESIFLLAFMCAGLYFEPFTDAGSLTVALTAGLGLIALAIRNTSSKTVIKNYSPSTMMTGNTTQLGIDLANFVKQRELVHLTSLLKSASIVLGFVFGAFMGALLYLHFSFWSVGFFIVPIWYLAFLCAKDQIHFSAK